MTSALLLGALVGLRHATDPDHLAAVSTLIAREPRSGRAASLGAAWSLGHGTTLLGVGGVALLLSAQLPPALGNFAELGVALVLVALGVSNLRHAFHPAPHVPAGSERAALLRSGFVGVAHGAAGSGLIAVAAAAAMPTPAEALLYLLAFATGTALAMVTFSTLLSTPLRWLAREPRRHRWIHAVTGGVSLLVGLALAFETVQRWSAA